MTFLESYLPILIALVFLVGLAIIMIVMNAVFGPKRSSKVKMAPFECGNPDDGSDARQRFSVKYYLVAIFFLVFDVEVVFLLPWVLRYREFLKDPVMAWVGLGEMLFFLALLVYGLVYVWKSKALDWD